MADEKNATSSVFCEVQKPWKPGVPSSYSKIPVEAESTLGGGDDKTAGEEEVKRLRRDRAQLWRAARAGDVGRVRELISQGHDPNSGNPRLLEATAMHYASLYGHREVMSILVDAGRTRTPRPPLLTSYRRQPLRHQPVALLDAATLRSR
eukprot:121686-Hanusia_phi.AAC.2